MLQPQSIQSNLSLRDKLFSIDYILVFSILVLGIISMFAMYSTDGGQFKYHTSSHILRFFVFFSLFFLVSLIQIRFWHDQSYFIYIIFFLLLIGVKYFGLTSSGSQRWLDLYFMNLQPSELMKVGLILFVAKYYISIQKWVPAINRLKIIADKYEKTIFVEEALHRLVEIHYHIGLKVEAEKYAKILGYNYNSGQWFEQSYKILNKDYEKKKKDKKKKKSKNEKNFVKKIIEIIK